MISINRNIQSEILMTTMEELVPNDSLFRKVDKYIWSEPQIVHNNKKER